MRTILNIFALIIFFINCFPCVFLLFFLFLFYFFFSKFIHEYSEIIKSKTYPKLTLKILLQHNIFAIFGLVVSLFKFVINV
ncbi:hypothetical protein BX070DRAFT_224540, partial [Coemansia spiralis]